MSTTNGNTPVDQALCWPEIPPSEWGYYLGLCETYQRQISPLNHIQLNALWLVHKLKIRGKGWTQ